MEEITRITTEYVETEDRIRLSGETPAGSTVMLWIPQRLLNRLIPLLCERIEPPPAAGPREEALNSFAQMAAVQSLAPMPLYRFRGRAAPTPFVPSRSQQALRWSSLF